jgi:Mce-associated membrane protein
VATLTTLDYQTIDAGFARWLDVATGPLREELSSAQDASKLQIAKAKTVTTGTVLEAAVTELDTSAGTARVIAAVEIMVKPEAGEQAAKRSRFQADLARTDAGWKLTGLAQVPYVPA